MSRGYKKKRTPKLDDDGNEIILTGDKREEALIRANNSIMYQLGTSPRSRHQLKTRLQEKGLPNDVIEEALEKFMEYGYINDTNFAAMWTESRHRSKGLARNAIRQELKQKGINQEDTIAALESVSDEDEYARAYALALQKAPSTKRLEKDARTRRLVGMLSRKGYSPGVAFKVVKEILALEVDEMPEGLED